MKTPAALISLVICVGAVEPAFAADWTKYGSAKGYAGFRDRTSVKEPSPEGYGDTLLNPQTHLPGIR